MVARRALEGHPAAGHGRRHDERAGLDPVGHDPVLAAAQALAAVDLDRVRARSARPRRPSSGGTRSGRRPRAPRRPGGSSSVPSARTAASIAFSVPITDTNGNSRFGPAQAARRAGEVVAVAVLDLGAQGPHRVDVEVDRPPADPVAARVADDHPAEPGEERAEQDERGAHLGRRLERHEQPVDVARGDLVDVRRPDGRRRRPRSRRVSAITRTSSISGTFVNRQRSPVRVAAASSLRAAFFEPLIGTEPIERPAALDPEHLAGDRRRA